MSLLKYSDYAYLPVFGLSVYYDIENPENMILF